MLKGGWWWKSCGRGLNGLYLTDPQDLTARQGIPYKYLDVKSNHFEFFFSSLRCCVVSMERMGLLPQALADDDKTEELERR